MIIPFNRMMTDFDNLMNEILVFIDHPLTQKLLSKINETAIKQNEFKSNHKYDVSKFGLTEEQIIKDCKPIYDTNNCKNLKNV